MEKENKNKENKKKKLIFNREKFVNFMNRHGFYIILFLCICIIGATAILTSDNFPFFKDRDKTIAEDSTDKSGNNNNGIDINIIEGLDKNQNSDKDGRKADDTAGKDQDIKQDDKGTDSTGNKDEKDTAAEGPKGDDGKKADGKADNKNGDMAKDSDKKEAKEDNDSVPASSDKAAKDMIMPVDGEIIKKFAMDELVYSRTLNSWSTHTGIDIAAKLGTEVKAARKGKVESIEEDALMGIIITLDHGDGIRTVYKGLSTNKLVTVGQEVEQGQTISGIGDTATLEVLDDPHLHFEVWVNGKLANPLDYIK